MQEAILKQLRAIEEEEQVRIVCACESGSRAWGFPSSDSDYDVRFIYVHPVDWYLSVDLEHKRDVIARGVEGILDISGWDLRKALRLLQKSNPALLEWLGSPIVYLEPYTVADQMRALRARYYSPVTCLYHYRRMAQTHHHRYLQGSVVSLKKYFYALRPLLAIRWIEQGLGVPPTEFQRLVEKVVDSPELKAEIMDLVAAKQQMRELDHRPHIARISRFIEDELARLEGRRFEQEHKTSPGPTEAFNRVFRAALAEVWS